MQTLKPSTEYRNATLDSSTSLKKLIVQIINDTVGLYFRQPLTKTLHDFNIIPIIALIYCATICEKIIALLSVNDGDIGIGLATVYVGFLGTVLGTFIRVAMDIKANKNS